MFFKLEREKKMSKCVRFSAIVVLALSVASFASTVEMVSFVQTTGASSSYNSATGTLVWSAGGSGTITRDGLDYSDFDSATITATFSGVTDLSSGGLAKAEFTSGTWQFDLKGWLSSNPATFTIKGTLNGTYNEAEADPDHLIGAAMANVTDISWNYDIFGGGTAIPVAWANPSNLGSLTASTLFADGFGLQAYNPNGWQSKNLSAQIDSVPEPATISLIVMGLAGLLRRKK
jgi:hypothetical protein